VGGEIPTGSLSTKNWQIYSKDRYITLSLKHIPGTPTTIEERQEILTAIHERFRPPTVAPEPQPVFIDKGVGKHVPDIQVIEKASKNDRTGELFRRLYKADETLWSGEDRRYPSPSEALWAFLHQLKFWTRGDKEQVERIFRDSDLYTYYYAQKWETKSNGSTWGAEELRKVFGETRDMRK
jgi:putative DNA primase/helicase